MRTLLSSTNPIQDEIDNLKVEIEGYIPELSQATDKAEKLMWGGLITARSKVLSYLMAQQQD